jgi:hypothetical protein
MRKQVKAILGILLLMVTLLAVGCGQDGVNSADSTPRTKLGAVQPNEDDGAIYEITKNFIAALVNDDKDQVLSLLTTEHRSVWTETSFLLSAAAKGQYDDIELGNLQYTVVKYLNNEETNFENTGIIFAVYDVTMKAGGQDESMKIQESLAFRKENGQWLISMDERGFLVKTN